MTARAEDSPSESLLQQGTRLLEQSRRLLFDLDGMVRGGEPDAIRRSPVDDDQAM
ncbi:MAG TPA: hypothetical protein VFU93_12605 [Acidimicrobiales bacterium]|nr:hypothetical protein [Acidimicrobiales bacterium]